MTPKEIAREIITSLNSADPLAVCSSCDRAFHVHRAGLFFLTDMSADVRGHLARWKSDLNTERAELRERRQRISDGSQSGAKAVNLGLILETLAPSLDAFPLDPHDCRSLGDPIDFIAFENLTQRGRVNRIILGDFKTGRARLSDRQRSIRSAVELKRLEWHTYEG